MKSSNLLMILLLLTVLVLGYFLLKDCEDCKSVYSETRGAVSDDYQLKVDCAKESIFQVFQYDLSNGYSIMGGLHINPSDSTRIDKIDFKLYEAGQCKRFKIVNVEYLAPNNPESFCDGHVFNFQIESLELNEKEVVYTWKDNGLTVKPGDNIHTIIKSSKFKEIVTIDCESSREEQLLEFFGPNFNPKDYDLLRHFPPFDCPAQFYINR